MQEMVRMESASLRNRNSLKREGDQADCPSTISSVCKHQSKTAILAFAMMLASTVIGHADSLRFTSIQMPALVQRGTNFWLSCQYELQAATTPTGEWPVAAASEQAKPTSDPSGQEQLYSVKWYKNNEEFYRIIFAPSPINRQPAAGQQQYFTQPGVNVLMSSSNATHVRLLNVSLESEGSFACEISTQNLSTIRFEKEIKVYVLPSARLNLIGLRGLYALGDQVELNCLSDFSRPAGALGWFINGRRVITSSEANARFRLEPQLTRRKANELKLVRSSLMLKFKLTNELLASVAPLTPLPMQRQSLDLFQRHAAIGNNFSGHHDGDSPATAQTMLTPTNAAATTSNRRNQSKLPLPNTGPDDGLDQDDGDDANSRRKLLAAVSGLRLAELLRLECRYKLTEVSDVTFSELKVAAAAAATALERPLTTSGVDGNNSNGWHRQKSKRGNVAAGVSARRRQNLQPLQQQASGGLDNREPCRGLRLSKSPTNQVQQSGCAAAAGRKELLDLLRGPWQGHSVACRAGLLALQREDPIILKLDNDEEEEEQEKQQDDWNGLNKADRVELAPGSTIGVNCSTLSALFGNSHQRLVVASGLAGQRPMAMQLDEDGQKNSRTTPVVNDEDQSVIYCSDTEARKRLLISGKYQTGSEFQWAHSNQRHKAVSTGRHQKQQQHHHHHQKRHHIAYVAFEQEDQQHKLANSNTNNINNGRHRHQLLANSTQLVPSDKLLLTPALNLNGAGARSQAAESSESAPWSMGTKSLDQLHDNLAAELEPDRVQQSAWLAPPLLEWFINNQEAAESSVKYSPELPLISSTAQQRQQTATAATDEDLAVSSVGQQPFELPSIDYREYFANFDSRNNDQHLALRMRLDKKLFMTPDSLLRLRCTSTQAQVLAMESLDVSLYAIPPRNGQAIDQNGKQHSNLSLSTTHQTDPSSSWNQRPTSIKSKYIHHKLPAGGQRGFGISQSASQSPSLQQSNGSYGNGQLSVKFQLLAAALWAIGSLQFCRP